MRSRLFLVAVAAAGALLGFGTTAVAAAPAGGTSSAASATPFAAQAKAAHLTAGQTEALKREVDRYLERTGGKQVALNKIDVDGATLLVAIPGEKKPRDFAGGDGARAAADPCLTGAVYSGYFCVYSQQTYSGSYYYWYSCAKRSMPWAGYGSWINDQTPGTRATFYNSSGGVHYTTPAPYSSNSSYYWTPVWHVRNC
ncbi:hypothetical protein [Streptomyces fragilis]|uniref:Secreted protein n=1 Tax=Streptomyces fragilis TaxID=67301 RepID=A0ABV2YRJ9_9ACTN|nr:hypothetical protein [Streptomyces fragilis]